MATAWQLFLRHKKGWVSEMVKVFVDVGFLSSADAAAGLASYSSSQLKRAEPKCSKCVECFLIDKMRSWLSRTTSKYGFLTRAYGYLFVISGTVVAAVLVPVRFVGPPSQSGDWPVGKGLEMLTQGLQNVGKKM